MRPLFNSAVTFYSEHPVVYSILLTGGILAINPHATITRFAASFFFTYGWAQSGLPGFVAAEKTAGMIIYPFTFLSSFSEEGLIENFVTIPTKWLVQFFIWSGKIISGSENKAAAYLVWGVAFGVIGLFGGLFSSSMALCFTLGALSAVLEEEGSTSLCAATATKVSEFFFYAAALVIQIKLVQSVFFSIWIPVVVIHGTVQLVWFLLSTLDPVAT